MTRKEWSEYYGKRFDLRGKFNSLQMFFWYAVLALAELDGDID